MSVEMSPVLEAALDRISDAARESATHQQPTPRHFVEVADLSARSQRLRQAVCGRWVSPNEVALRHDDVTCPSCKQELATAAQQEF